MFHPQYAARRYTDYLLPRDISYAYFILPYNRKQLQVFCSLYFYFILFHSIYFLLFYYTLFYFIFFHFFIFTFYNKIAFREVTCFSYISITEYFM